jgi:hypothetical protein
MKTKIIAAVLFAVLALGTFGSMANANPSNQKINSDLLVFDHVLTNDNYTAAGTIHEGYTGGNGYPDEQNTYVDGYLYYMSNHTRVHYYNHTFTNSFAFPALLISGDVSLNAPTPTTTQVCKIQVRTIILYSDTMLLSRPPKDSINWAVAVDWFQTGSFSIKGLPSLGDETSLNFDYELAGNYTADDFLYCNVTGTGANLGQPRWRIIISFWLYFFSNTTSVRFILDEAAIESDSIYSFDTGFTIPDTTEQICRVNVGAYLDYMPFLCSITPKNPDEVWTMGYSDAFTINKPAVAELGIIMIEPSGFENYTVGTTITIEWESSGGYPPITVTLWYTLDAGVNWVEIVANTTDDGEYEWDTTALTDHTTDYAYILGFAFDDESGMALRSTWNFTLYVEGTTPEPAPEHTGVRLPGETVVAAPWSFLGLSMDNWLMVAVLLGALCIVLIAVAGSKKGKRRRR